MPCFGSWAAKIRGKFLAMLLTWEECYYQASNSASSHGVHNFNRSYGAFLPEDLSRHPVNLVEDKLHSLIYRMMNNYQICLAGEGIIGRTASTGNYLWFLSDSHSKDAHPPEVTDEICHQFSAGLQTVAVIPVAPHGVVQLGSSFTIMENLGFVNDIKSLILQLGCIPGALFAMDSSEKTRVSGFPRGVLTEDAAKVGKITDSHNLMGNGNKQLSSSSDHSRHSSGHSDYVVREVQENSLMTSSFIHLPDSPLEKEVFCPIRQVERESMSGGVFSHKPDKELNQFIDSYSRYSRVDFQADQVKMSVQHCSETVGKQMSLVRRDQIQLNTETRDSPDVSTSQLRVLDSSKSLDTSQFLEGGKPPFKFQNHSRTVDLMHSFSAATELSFPDLTEIRFQSSGFTELEGIPLFSLSDELLACTTEVLSGDSDQINNPLGTNHPRIGSIHRNPRMGNDSATTPNFRLTCLNDDKPLHETGFHTTMPPSFNYVPTSQWSGGDNLSDILGVDMQNKTVTGKVGITNLHKLGSENLIVENIQEADQDLALVKDSLSELGVFSMTGSDHLLDAVVCGTQSALKQNSVGSLSLPSNSLPHCQSNTTGKVQEDSLGTPELPSKEENLSSSSLKPSCTNKNEATCSASSSFCSQVKLLANEVHSMKRDSNILTAHSKGPDEAAKPCRKKLKHGETTKPRPKDRQMIQDRLKDLRDIVPNGGKCSIDVLLERTVKHMLFLQGVMKHVDKLKQAGQLRITNKEGRMVLKGNFEGGATWAFEVGSQSGVCPIIVEDLNPPRELLIEIMCEDQGFFLEIADVIRTLGLTILTGVIESGNGKVWARFAVEANRDVTRMEVFMSLVHALEETMNGSAMLIPHLSIASSRTPGGINAQ
ncbi:hypothetical protein SAY86_001607 [Trapa natans]|uniref:BHLH domain-containing protein n=1 Tax=Trapa natans TaxID=22666 RepID=A0AAN7LBT3_TRANT|nr:hypothetical protein SAY86_001607 [Trapa natans]